MKIIAAAKPKNDLMKPGGMLVGGAVKKKPAAALNVLDMSEAARGALVAQKEGLRSSAGRALGSPIGARSSGEGDLISPKEALLASAGGVPAFPPGPLSSKGLSLTKNR